MTVIHGGDVWRGALPEDYLDFSANLNPEGPPQWVREALALGLERARFYPDLSGAAARLGMAAHLGVEEDCVLVTAGGIEAAALVARRPARHVIAQPTFQEYGRLCGDHQSVIREKLLEHRFSKGELLWICNPNNPSGDALSRDFLSDLLDRAVCAGAGLVVDEAFIEYCPEHSVADLAAKRPSLTILGSLTKVLAIPGARLGYIVAAPNVTFGLSEGLLPWRLNCVADAVAAALPGHRQDFDAIRRLNDTRRARFARGLEALGARVYPSDANFLLCDFGRDMRNAIERLKERGMLVRPCGMFPGLNDGFVRLCVRTEAENKRLVAALGDLGSRE